MSVVGAGTIKDCSAESKAARAKSEIDSRRGGNRKKNSARSAREALKFDTGDLTDLILASKLVPTGQLRANSMYHEHACDASTAVPSSSEPSPVLMCVESDLWPSLQQVEAAKAGWDLCSEASDLDVLPEPALPLDEDGNETHNHGSTPPENVEQKWWLLGEDDGGVDDAEEAKEIQGRLSFADILKSKQVVQKSPTRGQATAHSCRNIEKDVCDDPCSEDHTSLDQSQIDHQRRHGWKPEHKASRNAKQQRKVAESKAKRITQSCKSRGWLD